MKITLKKDGQKKEYTVGYINMLTVRRAMEIQENIQNGTMDLSRPTPAQLDMLVDFIVETFEKQFTREDLYNGWPAQGFVARLLDIVNQIVEMLVRKAEELPED